MLTDLLESYGATVTACLRATEALAAFKRDRFDFIISNLLMPEQDGCWLIQQIRQYEAEHKIVRTFAIALTVATSEAERRHALESGFDRHISKPFEVAELIEKISPKT
jgi:CheY-like chemotaxis protein